MLIFDYFLHFNVNNIYFITLCQENPSPFFKQNGKEMPLLFYAEFLLVFLAFESF